jgi:glycosyltransferase involved in cell wall biosynthesis
MRMFRPRPRIVWHIRDVMRGKRRFFPLVDALGRYVPDAIVANSDYTAGQFRRCRSRVVRVYNGLILDDYRPASEGEKAAFKRRWDVPVERRLVGILGVITPLKGHRVFLDAARAILAKRDDVHFFVVGDEIYDTAGHRGYRKLLEGCAASLGLAGRVTFTGFLDPVETVLPCLDVLVQSSVEAESFGRVVVEAQASGVPVVASRVGAIPEIITSDDVGALVAPGSADEIVDAVLRYLADDALCRRVAAEGRRHAIENFSITRVIAELTHLYDGLLSGSANRD